MSRILLALAFVPTALVKVTGQRFTTMPVDTTLGFFFEAMYRTGAYWRFLGWAQLVAGVLLLVPRTQTLGAVLFFPIALNIFFITVSLEFKGTPVVTGLMALANLFLLCWDYDRLKSIFWPASTSVVDRWNGPGPRIERAGYAVGAAGALGALLWTRGFAGLGMRNAFLLMALLGALMVLTGWVQAYRGRARARYE